MENKRGIRKTLIGIVVSDKMDKTVVVQVTRRVLHPKYKKYVTTRLKYKAHDATNDSGIGDRVLIVQTRPLSKEKRWAVRENLERGERV